MQMTRKKFLATTAASVAIANTLTRRAAAAVKPPTGDRVTTLDIRSYILSNSPWVDPKRTVDTVKIGDPTRPVKKAGVCWMPSIWDIRAAHDAGCELLICHEPTFWEHAAPENQWRTIEPGIAKREFLENTGMVILRIHDSWDNWPELGIRDSWAKALGLTVRIREGTNRHYHGMYRIAPQPLRQFAQYVANRVKRLGEDSVQVIGDPEKIVTRPSLGVGCIVPDKEMVDYGSDVLIMCFDGAGYWSTRERLAEMGAALITVEHGTSEMPGLESLCKHLASVFPAVKFRYLAEHPRPWTVNARKVSWFPRI